jgi:cation diffusion facilitator CzcD-associated flavoprotein CzcO
MVTTDNPSSGEQGAAKSYDAVIVGAGLAGLYMLYRLREQGLSARVLEAAPSVGGTWYWNAYPGARCDVPSLDYSYSFSPELEQEWVWTERYPSQPEILKYINHVADRFELRPDIQLETFVESAVYDESTNRWMIRTDTGEEFRAQFFIMATGCLSTPLDPPFEGLETFEGEWYQTQKFPQEGVSFVGKRVGIVGTGSSAVQSVPVIAEDASHLYVFQRTPNFSVPANNYPLEPEVQAHRKKTYREHRQQQRYSGFGYGNDIVVNERAAKETPEEQRRAELERRWEEGGAPNFMVSFNDLLTDAESNEIVGDFVREKIRQKVSDPEVAALLTPTDHHLATKRLCVDSNYFETFNRDNVSLINIRPNPIAKITPRGIQLENGDEYELDSIVFAVGYDAMTGSLLRVDIKGRGGRSLREDWSEGPRTYLGLGISGYPNLFTVTGPLSPTVLAVMIVAIEQHVEWISDCIAHMRRNDLNVIEPTIEAEDEWVEHAIEIGNATLFPTASSSYYVGANVPGKPRVFTPYVGGFGVYREKCDEVAAEHYAGFQLC